MKISIVTPVYNAVNIVDELYNQLVENVSRITDDFEIVMVNDACPYGSGEKIAALARKDSRVKFIDLARNFGQHIAISAGLDYASGDYVVVMDCDLQDPPDKIGVLFDALKQSGKEVAFSVRENRKEGFLKLFYSKTFSSVMRLLSDKIYVTDKNIGNFSIVSAKVVKEIRKLREYNRSYFGLVKWCGFDICYCPIEAQARFEGKSGYTFFKSLKHAFHILMQQSVKPLFVSVAFSLLCFVASFVFAGLILYNHFAGNYAVNGYAGIMFALTFIGALLFLTLAIMSVYLANIFQESHRRPLYVVGRSMNVGGSER